MSVPSILVIGLGELGEQVVQSLATHPQRKTTRIAVLLRSKKLDQVAKLRAWNASLVAGDVVEDSPEALVEIFTAYHTVICCTGMFAPPATQMKIAHSVLAAGVSRYFPWQFGIDYDIIGRNSSQDLFDSQLDVRDLLRAQTRTQWVIVSTGMFISFLFEPAFGLVDSKREVVTALGSWENAITVTAPEDIGRVTAELALVFPDTKGVVFVSGDTVSMRRLADVVEKATGTTVERVLKTVADLKSELAEQPSDAMRKYRVVFAEGRGVAWAMARSFNRVHNIETETVDDWAGNRIGHS